MDTQRNLNLFIKMNSLRYILASVIVIYSCSQEINAQKHFNQWCFGKKAGLNFSTIPPTTFTCNYRVDYYCASVSDANGNLQFYTNGDTIWNMNHQVMANGTNLGVGLGNNTSHPIILPKPGSGNLYYMISAGVPTLPDKYFYSIIDMSLSAGTGSVIIKKAPLWQPQENCYQITATKHCNGIDYWIITHEAWTSKFHSYLLTATGINTVPVVSVQGNTLAGAADMKISPAGNRIAFGNTAPPTKYLAVHDFDNGTGSIGSNSIILTDVPQYIGGLEFSSDGSKLYASNQSNNQDKIWQWDLCAGSQTAVAASVNTLSAPIGTANPISMTYGLFQLAPDGKIYVARVGQPHLGVINNPNQYGTSCNFVNLGQLLLPGVSSLALPKMPTSSFKNIGATPNYSVTCSTATFSAPQHAQSSNGCAAIGPTLLSTKWNFGDPNSGTQNTSFALNPSHVYTAAGSYSAYIVLNYPCSSDTLRVLVNVTSPAPSFSVVAKTSICKNVTQTLSVSDAAFTYSWSGLGTSTAVVVSPSVTITYSVLATNTVTGCSSTKLITINVSTCLGFAESQDVTGEVLIYPIPSTGSFNLQSEQAVIELEVLDASGKLILHKKELSIKEFSLPTNSKGLFFVRIKTEKGMSTKKVVLE